MGNKLYVGNLAYSVRDETLQEAFSQFGTVTSAKVMMDARPVVPRASALWKWRLMPRRKPLSTA
ncbi:RNA recognition motif-containing protein [Roseateles depolymerans]|nr:RNA recognition motif-containing protein [Roseateles depolymerans]